MATKPVKRRLDELLVERGLVADLATARGVIMSGKVFSREQRLDKAGLKTPEDRELEVRGQDHPWVSRGGIKLAHGLQEFGIDVEGAIALDVGSSTGGFTDVLLHNNAIRVYAVDVGSGQLAWKLRTDERVVVLEKTNARHLNRELVPEAVDLVVCDASFIRLQSVLPAALDLVSPKGQLVSLIKPQFEVERHQVGERGVVRDPDLHDQICRKISDWLNSLPDWQVRGLSQSPITGPEGNIEFLIWAQKK